MYAAAAISVSQMVFEPYFDIDGRANDVWMFLFVHLESAIAVESNWNKSGTNNDD